MKKILTILLIIFLYNSNVYAASVCDYKEQTAINQKVSNVKASYEVITETVEYVDMNSTIRVFDISIFNITEEFYAIIKNNVTEEEKYFTSDDAENGIVHFKWTYAEEVTNFTIQIYTTDKTSCPNEKYKTIYLTTPRYNEFYKREICSEYEDFYLCQEFVTFSKVSSEKFLEKLDSYRNGEIDNSGEKPNDNINLKPANKIIVFLDNYKWYILGGTIIIIAGIVIARRIKTKKQGDLGL